MNTNEIVISALRCENQGGADCKLCEYCKIISESGAWHCDENKIKQDAADEIERLQKELVDYNHLQKVVDGQAKQNARLQKELDAAVADIYEADRFRGHCFRCKSWNGTRCKRGYSVNASFCNEWQWRGRESEGT